jgi:hypothetical protein
MGLDINNRGEITGNGFLPNGDEHAFLLIPTDGDSDQNDAAVDANRDSFAVFANAKAPTPRVSKGPFTRLGDGRSGNRF